MSHIGLSNGGNLIFWLYVAGLPVGPIWLLHSFNTLVAALMLFWYLRYETDWFPSSRPLLLEEAS